MAYYLIYTKGKNDFQIIKHSNTFPMIEYIIILNLCQSHSFILLQQQRNPFAHFLSTIFILGVFLGIRAIFKAAKNPNEVISEEEKKDILKIEEIKNNEELKTQAEIDTLPKVISKTETITNTFLSKKTKNIKLDFEDGSNGTIFYIFSDNYYFFKENNSEYQYRYKNFQSCVEAFQYYLYKKEILKKDFLGTFIYNSPVK